MLKDNKDRAIGKLFSERDDLIAGLSFRLFFLLSLLHLVHVGKHFNLGYFQIPFSEGLLL